MDALWAVFAAGMAAAFGIVAAGLAIWVLNRQVTRDADGDRRQAQLEAEGRELGRIHRMYDAKFGVLAERLEKVQEDFDLYKREQELPEGMYVMKKDPTTGKRDYVRAEDAEDQFINQMNRSFTESDAADLLDDALDNIMSATGVKRQ